MDEYTYKQLNDTLENLKQLRKQGYRYLARSQHGELKAFISKPIKEINFWRVKGELPHAIDPYSFDDVKWSDSLPLKISSEIKRLESSFDDK